MKFIGNEARLSHLDQHSFRCFGVDPELTADCCGQFHGVLPLPTGNVPEKKTHLSSSASTLRSFTHPVKRYGALDESFTLPWTRKV
jgi:hypothetical protein